MSIIIVVGGSKGIGLEIALQLQQQGHIVYATSRNPENVQQPNLRLLPLEITSSISIERCVQTVIERHGRIDVVINNAGYDLYGAAEDTSYNELLAQLETNFLGIVQLISAVLPIMRQQHSGRIINVSSIGGLVALPFNSAYAASKFALEGYSESLRYEVLPFNIYVSLIEPGQAKTDTLNTSIRNVTSISRHYEQEPGLIARNARASGQKAALTTKRIARAVVQVVSTKQPRLRYTVGQQAFMVPLMKQILPARLFEWFILRQFVHPIMNRN